MDYLISPDSASNPDSVSPEEADLSLLLSTRQKPSELNTDSLIALRQQVLVLKPRTLQIYQALGDWILQAGEPLIAYDVLAEGLRQWSQDVRLRQLMALALVRSSSLQRANTLLLQLQNEGCQDEETLGLLARTYKGMAMQTLDPQERKYRLKQACDSYAQAYQITGGYWTGINAATLAMILGEVEYARTLTHQIRAQCIQELATTRSQGRDPYWLLATLGEAALILGELSEAEDWYAQTAQVGHGRLGDLSSTRRNARLLLQYLEADVQRIDRYFEIPSVIVFAGHMIDLPDRSTPRFPPELEPMVSRAIHDRLQKLNAHLGYASAACGSDILFLEALLELGGEAHIVLPYNQEEFIQDSVALVPESNWQQRFQKVLERSNEVVIASQQRMDRSSLSYQYANQVLFGLAQMRAEQLGTQLASLAVWDNQPGDGLGGTATMVNYWRQQGLSVELIDLQAILQTAPIHLPTAAPSTSAKIEPTTSTTDPLKVSRQIMAIVFADVVRFSRLTEDQIAAFVESFLGAIAPLTESLPSLMMKNTWGDSLYFVFSSLKDAGRCALDLQELMQNTSWSSKGLPEDLNLRIALHAGPVYQCQDPVTGRVNYIGSHVNHAARIEPITPPGQVYSSQAFAALAAAERINEFTCDYVGLMSWAKGYGTFPTYHVWRQRYTKTA